MTSLSLEGAFALHEVVEVRVEYLGGTEGHSIVTWGRTTAQWDRLYPPPLFHLMYIYVCVYIYMRVCAYCLVGGLDLMYGHHKAFYRYFRGKVPFFLLRSFEPLVPSLCLSHLDRESLILTPFQF